MINSKPVVKSELPGAVCDTRAHDASLIINNRYFLGLNNRLIDSTLKITQRQS